MRKALPVLLSLALAASAAGLFATCRSLPDPSEFHPGMLRADLVTRFGQPVRTEILTKRSEHIFGPVETFWSTMPMGFSVEIWSFEARGGWAEVYFLDGAEAAGGTGFHDEDAVY